MVKSLGAIRADALAGLIDPGGITIVRRIERPVATGVSDTALFSGPRADYDVTVNADGTTTVNHARGTAADGVDTLRNIEVLQFTEAQNVAPTVTARTPAVNAIGVAVGGNVTATFSEAVQGVNTTTFQLRNAAGTAIAGAVTQAGNVWTLNPNADLAAGTTYTVTLTGGATAIRDLAVPAAPLVTTTWSFTTAAAVNAPPTVTARAPAVGATGVPVGNDITATFSEAVHGVSNTTFIVRSNAAPGTVIAATATQNGTTNQWVLNPTADLAANTTYTVTLTGGAAAIRDLANAPLATTTWSFTTAAAVVVNAPPTVTARAPAVGRDRGAGG